MGSSRISLLTGFALLLAVFLAGEEVRKLMVDASSGSSGTFGNGVEVGRSSEAREDIGTQLLLYSVSLLRDSSSSSSRSEGSIL
ncbi:hypothetical protein FPQ18DRAFT_327824 [Pyronema domesticum]|nr:hypothetical protein FPQ18DRAFT_327824 [Pyronema domesticum]